MIAPPPPARPRLVPQAGPATWRAEELGPADYMVPLGSDAAAELEAALAGLGGRAPEVAADAPLPRLGPVLRDAVARLDTGRGFVLLRGLSLLDRIGDAPGAQEALLRVIGAHLGRALPLGPGGEVVGRLSSPAAGGAAPLRWRFHADPCDAVALLILRQPPDMDPAMLVSAAHVHNELMRRDRGALEELYHKLPHVQPGQGGARGVPVGLPVFSLASGAFVGRYARDSIEAAQRLPETPRLTGRQMEALDLLDAVCAEPGFALRIEARPGDLLLFNPLMVWKRRAEVAEAGPEPAAPGREALRLWLLTENSRALPEGLAAVQPRTGDAEATETATGMVGG